MKHFYIFSLSCSFLIFIIEGKPCPEKSRPHKTRCETYYKCVDLPPQRHVWIPVTCEEGLVYEPKLFMCVLPPDDWECLQGIDENDETNNNIEVPEDLSTKTQENPELVSKNDAFEGSGAGDTNEDSDNLEQKTADTVEILDESATNVDPQFTQQLQRLSELVKGLRKDQETKQSLELRHGHLNNFYTNFNIKNQNSGENYIPSPISSTTAAPIKPLQTPFVYNNGSGLKPETKLILSNIFGFPNYAQSQMHAVPQYNPHHSQEIPNISAETLNTVLELSKQLANQNMPKILPNGDYFNQAIIQPVIFPIHPGFYNYNQQRPMNKNKKKYNNNKNPSHTIIRNNVHIEAPNAAQKNPLLDSYGQLYPPLNENKLYHASLQAHHPSVSTEISVTTAVPLEFQVTPQTIEKFYTPSPYLTDQNANNLYTSYQHSHNYENQNFPMFPTQIDPSKIKIRPNAQHYDTVEQDSAEYYAYSQPQTFNQNRFPQYLMPSSTTARPLYANYFPQKYENAHMVHFGGNFVPYEIFQKSILPLLGPTSDLSQVEFIHCAAGVRQPNATECTRYYVCSKKNGKVLSYSCPPYTAFNANTRVCDASTYASCVSPPVISPYSSNGNTMLALQALQSQAMLQMLQNNEREQNSNLYKESDSVFSGAISSSTTMRPTTSLPTKRKYYCKEGDKVADQMTSNSYFVCFKNEQGHMKGHKMTCPTGLIFCAVNTKCTLSERCK